MHQILSIIRTSISRGNLDLESSWHFCRKKELLQVHPSPIVEELSCRKNTWHPLNGHRYRPGAAAQSTFLESIQHTNKYNYLFKSKILKLSTIKPGNLKLESHIHNTHYALHSWHSVPVDLLFLFSSSSSSDSFSSSLSRPSLKNWSRALFFLSG